MPPLHCIALLTLAFTGAVVPAAAGDGRAIYLAKCASCHGADGKSGTPAGKKLRAKDLTESKLADGDVEKQIVNGTKDSRGNVRMPSFKGTLTAEEITALITFVKSLRR